MLVNPRTRGDGDRDVYIVARREPRPPNSFGLHGDCGPCTWIAPAGYEQMSVAACTDLDATRAAIALAAWSRVGPDQLAEPVETGRDQLRLYFLPTSHLVPQDRQLEALEGPGQVFRQRVESC